MSREEQRDEHAEKKTKPRKNQALEIRDKPHTYKDKAHTQRHKDTHVNHVPVGTTPMSRMPKRESAERMEEDGGAPEEEGEGEGVSPLQKRIGQSTKGARGEGTQVDGDICNSNPNM